jgi:arylsulfatase A-like enzyme/tetratricopeptide (TPR) repeat protein
VFLASASCQWAAPGSSARPAAAVEANVLLISIDTLRADRLPPYGYTAIETPTISTLAAEGVRFANAYTPVPLTLPAHVSVFTGLLPISHGIRDNGVSRSLDGHATLAKTLDSKGYTTGAFVSAFVLDSRWGLARGFDRYFDDFTVSAADIGAIASVQRAADVTWREARAWLDANASSRFFAWVHFFDPHTPYAPPSAFRSKYPTHAYDGEIAYVDSVVGEIVKYVQSRRLLEKTLVVLISDHGEGLGDHDEDEHGLLAYDSTLHVPWIMRLPNRQLAGRVIDEAVSLVDVFPTITGLLGFDTPSNLDGTDRTGLIHAGDGSTDALYAETLYPRLRMGWSEVVTLRSGEFKYIRAPQPELYNYRTDPSEKTNLVHQHGDVVVRLGRIIDRIVTDRATIAGATRANASDPRTVKQLQALGYVSGAVATVDPRAPLANPTTKTQTYREVMRARQQLAEGHEADGLRALQSVVIREPALEVARRSLRDYWIGKSRFDEAKGWLRFALARHSDNAELWREMAIITRAAADASLAKEAIHRSIAINPEDPETLLVLGEIQRDAGDFAAALASFRSAAQRAVDSTLPNMQVVQTLIAMRRYAEAESTVQSVLSTDPNAASAHYMLAQIAEARRDPMTAEFEYRQELERGPWDYRARFNLALLLGARGDRRAELAMLQSIPAIAPNFGEVHFYIAKALLDLGERTRLEEAARAARRGLELAPNAPSAPLGHYVLADVYQLSNRPADAARELQRGRELERHLNAQR